MVLKTDAHNEAWIYPESIPIAPHLECDGVICLEYDLNVIDWAKKWNWKRVSIEQWDIRSLEVFENEYFDTIIDLSTIDHIAPKDVASVLDWYKRVLKKDGKILMVAWTGHPWDSVTIDSDIQWEEWNSWNQYYFNRKWLEWELVKRFKINYQEDLFELKDWPDTNVLILYKLENVI